MVIHQLLDQFLINFDGFVSYVVVNVANEDAEVLLDLRPPLGHVPQRVVSELVFANQEVFSADVWLRIDWENCMHRDLELQQIEGVHQRQFEAQAHFFYVSQTLR